MARPQNPLDEFAAYTYHFELHVAKTYNDLKYLRYSDANLTTTPWAANGTLLINTRKDAHQHIDNVKYTYNAPLTSLDNATALTCSLTVFEPNGHAFIEKLQMKFNELQVRAWGTLCFVLKILFVGRDKDNNITTLPPIIVPLSLTEMKASFDHQGGTYQMDFGGGGAGLIRASKEHNKTFGYVNKAIHLKSKTLQDALMQLENHLNTHYEETIKNETEPTNDGLPIKYIINLDPQLQGQLEVQNKQDFAQDPDRHITIEPRSPILHAIRQIVLSTREVNEMIAESKEGLKKERHPNVRLPTFNIRFNTTDTATEIIYDISLYEGDVEANRGEFEFWYLFTPPSEHVNVDIIKFDINFNANLLSYLTKAYNSTHHHTGQDGESLKDSPSRAGVGAIVPNKTIPKNPNQTPEPYSLDTLPNDTIVLPASPRPEDAGWASLTWQGAAGARQAFNTLFDGAVSADAQLRFRIRGHYDLFFNVPTPDNEIQGFGTRNGVWIKVHVKDQWGRPFFYTGWYYLVTVECEFSDGHFEQELFVLLHNRDAATENRPSANFADSAFVPFGTSEGE